MTTLINNLSQIVTLESAFNKDGRKLLPQDLSIIENGAVIYDENSIVWVGNTNNVPQENFERVIDGSNHVLLPELVDSHTHLIFGGNRAKEYVMRLNGADYQEIANAGGGILNTVQGTNALNSDQLFQLCCERIERISSYGIGTIEIKSGYGLTKEKEMILSSVIDKLKKHFYPRVQIFNTYMAAHAVPKDFSSSSEYVQKIVIPLLEELAPKNIIDAVDIFHEQNYFDADDVKLLFDKSVALGLKVKSHADEFQDNSGATLAATYNALSTDHLLRTGDEGIASLASSSTVATLLPGTGFFLGKPQADGRKFLDAGCKVAIASDYNPGSCHCDNLLLLASIGAPQYKMNIAELVCAITLNAAHALGKNNQGAILNGMHPRFSMFQVNTIDEIFYNWGRNFNRSLD